MCCNAVIGKNVSVDVLFVGEKLMFGDNGKVIGKPDEISVVGYGEVLGRTEKE